MTIEFSQPDRQDTDRVHHARAAAGNAAVAEEAIGVLRDALSGPAPVDRILLKAAAGAGKSFVLKRLVADAVDHPSCARVAIVAFTNKQIHPLAISLGRPSGRTGCACSSPGTGTTTSRTRPRRTRRSSPRRRASRRTAR